MRTEWTRFGVRDFDNDEAVDISAEVFGKYQHCTLHDGLWWADSDFANGAGGGRLKRGAMPSPRQIDHDAQVRADFIRSGNSGYQPSLMQETVVDNSAGGNIWIALGLLAGVVVSILLFYFTQK